MYKVQLTPSPLVIYLPYLVWISTLECGKKCNFYMFKFLAISMFNVSQGHFPFCIADYLKIGWCKFEWNSAFNVKCITRTDTTDRAASAK